MMLVGIVRLVFLASLLVAGYGLTKLFFYTDPMVEKDYRSALESPVGDKVNAMYGFGVKAFEEWGDARRAKIWLSEAYNELTKNTGLVPADRRETASKIQHMLGVVNEADEQFRLAIAAYEESLKSNPDNMDSKYNLERLKKKYPDLGGQKPDQQGGNAPGNKQKGI